MVDLIWIAAVLFLPVAALVILVLPRYLVRPGLSGEGLERRRVQNEVARTVVQVVGGVLLLLTANFTWQEIQSTQDQLQVAREGQITERYTRANDQLGDDEAQVRVGAIYALERIARDSRRDRAPVMDVLSTFVRERAPVNPGDSEEFDEIEARRARPPIDIQAAVTVMGRRNRDGEPTMGQCDRLGEPRNFPCVLNLERVDLTGAQLVGSNFDRVNLGGARLRSANLAFASFRGAELGFADVRLANFRLADFTEASLNNTFIDKTNLHLVKRVAN